jgi:hypothetical protein
VIDSTGGTGILIRQTRISARKVNDLQAFHPGTEYG